MFDYILSLHEEGHYLSTNQTVQRCKRFVFTQNIKWDMPLVIKEALMTMPVSSCFM